MTALEIILLSASAAAAAGGFAGRRIARAKLAALPAPAEAGETEPAEPDAEEEKRRRKLKKASKLWFVLSLAGSWLFTVELLGVIFGKGERGEFTVELTAERIDVFGISLSTTIIMTWIVMAVLTLAALIIRIFVIPRFKPVPHGIQNVLETAVGEITKYIDSKVGGMGVSFGAYIFTVAAFMIGCACAELFGVRAPTADITMTLAMALITFVLINAYGIARRGVGGRIKSLASPTPLVFPIRVICDCAVPVSMACRLFGNMLGGMIVMDLLYYAMGGAAVGIPSVVGLYFNVFHPLIQAFIFVTLTLTFINEATEEPGD